MISVVTFKWKTPGYRSRFTGAHVNTTRAMVARHYPHPHRFLCVTDDPAGLDAGVEVVPLWDDHATLHNPTWPNGPNCYRRLKLFSAWFAAIAGDRIVSLDLDAVITADLTPLWSRSEDLLIWHTGHPQIPYCGSMYMFSSSKNRDLWDDFDPLASPKLSTAAGMKGSDQGWITYKRRHIPGWGPAEGVYSYRDHCVKQNRGRLPANARMVMFHGKPDPWESAAHKLSPWIREHYRGE